MLKISPLPDNPKISVITVSLNHAEFIERNILSVLVQNYPNVEHIVIDGGSTDDTISILKKYPHLDWISEPDRGQSHALNKGFAKATGDIICWLNSDDFYPLSTFSKVIQELRTTPFIMGGCQVVDKDQNPTLYVENRERNWFDLIRYWIDHASPSQPSIFFRRELLEMVKREDDRYVDESLYYTMDLDLWLRMAKLLPKLPQTNEVLSIASLYDECKTGGDPEPMFREMSRVFRRHEPSLFEAESRLTLLLDSDDFKESVALSTALSSLCNQRLKDFQIIVLLTEGANSAESYKRVVREFAARLDPTRIRTVMRNQNMTAHSLIRNMCTSPYFAFVDPHTELNEDFTETVINSFLQDKVAAIALGASFSQMSQSEIRRALSIKTFRKSEWAFRKVAFLEDDMLSENEKDLIPMHEMLFKASIKGWELSSTDSLLYRRNDEASGDKIDPKEMSRIKSALTDLAQRDPFYELRRKSGYSFDTAEIHVPHITINIPKEKHTFSIVTPSFNQAAFLEECIDSVLSQGWKNLQYIIMDGGSTDGSVDIIKRYERHLSHWESKPDGGQYAAVQEGFHHASGDIYAWMNADDKYRPNAFAAVSEICSSNPHVQWLSGRCSGYDANGNVSWVDDHPNRYYREKLLQFDFQDPWIQQESVFWTRSLWETAGSQMDLRWKLAGDLELWRRFFRHQPLYTCDVVLAGFRSQPEQRSKLFLNDYIREAHQIIEEERQLVMSGEFQRFFPSPEPIAFEKAVGANLNPAFL